MENELKQVRIGKMQMLKDAGMNPFTSVSFRTYYIDQAISDFEKISSSQEKIVLSGRIMSKRGQGALMFCDFFDGTGRFQALIKKDDMDETKFNLFGDAVDIGDFCDFHGTLLKTKTDQMTIQVSDWNILTKSLLPLPDKWHGLQDTEEKFRKRYLDILFDQDLKNTFLQKSKFWDVTRDFMKKNGFVEVETPTLEVTTGGAEANPFKTHHNDFDIPVYMRISVGELWQKRLMSAGFPKTFEIGRVYRNEGSSPDHLQEFTNMEFYLAYASYKDGMKLVREMYIEIAEKVFGTTVFETRGHKFDLKSDWVEIDYADEILKQANIDIFNASEESMLAKCKELKIVFEGNNKERLIDTLWKFCRKKISGPAFLIHHPKIVSPLAKTLESDPRKTERFNIILAGSEVGNGFSELNDPIDQRERFANQEKLLKEGDSEAMMPDMEFVEMLEHGMPPACGFGFGERLFSFLVNKPIREVQYFPLMRPKNE